MVGVRYRVPVLSGTVSDPLSDPALLSDPVSGTSPANPANRAMQAATFRLGLKAVASVTPYAKKLTDDEIGFLFLTIPQAVKDAVTDQMWAYACSQYRLDPSPNKEMPLDQQLLSYVYRTRNGRPALEWGVKEDLPHRMRHADRFHPPILTEGQGAAPTLPPVSNPLLQGGI